MKNLKFVLLCYFLVFSTNFFGQDADSKTTNLANKIQNPIADLVSIPFQNNIDFYDGFNRNTLNIQPVTPFSVKDKFNIIVRTIIPISSNPITNTTGLGNVTLSAFFTPSKPGKVIWGLGPALQFGTNEKYGFQRTSIAPSAVALYQKNGWTFGALMQNFFGLGNDASKPQVNLFYTQIFVTKNLANGWYVNSAPIITNDWKLDNGLVLPIGAGFGKLMKLGKLPLNAQIGYYSFIKHPANAKGQLRIQATFILPKFY
jgi:hypothetical protein